jgi:hypothetical protein
MVKSGGLKMNGCNLSLEYSSLIINIFGYSGLAKENKSKWSNLIVMAKT